SFGMALVERRRKSESRLPKSVPPPRSDRARAATAAAANVAIPAAPPVPRDVSLRESEEAPRAPLAVEDFVSDGAMRAFKRELETAAHAGRALESGSLTG